MVKRLGTEGVCRSMYVLLLVGASSTAQPTRQLHYVDVAHAVHARRPWAAAAGCASIQAEAEAQDAQLQAGPQEQLALLFSRPDGMVALPHVHGLHSQSAVLPAAARRVLPLPAGAAPRRAPAVLAAGARHGAPALVVAPHA
jgi:hypothetical protein